MKHKLSALYFLLFVSIFTAAAQHPAQTEQLRKHVNYLASEQLQGRKAGTNGDSLAAVYIREQFEQSGLSKFTPSGFQYYKLVTDVTAGAGNKMSVNGVEYTHEKDFQPFSFSVTGKLSAPVTFAGFGIEGKSDSLQWNDFAGLNIKDRWILVLRGDPEPGNNASGFIPLSSDRAKALMAKDKGAAGLLLVSPSSIERSDRPIDITFDKSVSDAGLPVISITRKVAAAILKTDVAAIDSIEKRMIDQKKPVQIVTESIFNAETIISRSQAVSRNVVYYLEGTDPAHKDEYIVIGAHYDHLGTGGSGSGSRVPDEHAVHGGADDNASGVAALIEMARYFALPANRPSRSLIFASFGAEEMGLIGSRHFIDKSPVPVSSIKAMINLDMVGRLKDAPSTVSISGTGTWTVADSVLDVIEKGRSFTIRRTRDGYGPSDHAAFYTAGIPVSYLTTGAHSDYHTPADSPEKLNYQGLSEITAFTADLATALANLQKTPVFAEAGSKKEPGHYSRNLKVTLGIMPDVSGAETSGGMKVEGTRKDGPAARGGMLKGDIITAINGMKVGNIYDYMSRLGKLKPGETVNVEILRNNQTEILILQL